jgi:hypothetical protein
MLKRCLICGSWELYTNRYCKVCECISQILNKHEQRNLLILLDGFNAEGKEEITTKIRRYREKIHHEIMSNADCLYLFKYKDCINEYYIAYKRYALTYFLVHYLTSLKPVESYWNLRYLN